MPRITKLNFAIAAVGLVPLVARASVPASQPAVSPDVVVPQGLDDGGSPPGIDPPGGGGGPPGNVAPGNGAPGNGAPGEDARPRRQERFANGEGGGGGGRGHLLQRLMQPLTQKDIADAMIYMKDKSPNRYQALNSLPDGDRKKSLLELWARNYLNWMHQLSDDPELYSVVLKRIGAEDEVFGLVSKLRTDSADKKDETNAKLRDEVGVLVDLGIKERQLRLDRLEKTVKEQQQKLTEDTMRRDQLIDDRLKTIVTDGVVPGPGGAAHGRR